MVRQYLSLTGTLQNCAGGPMRWNSWISCEEIVTNPNDIYAKHHGYAFEVSATTEMGVADPTPIKAMGRFNHEAIAVDPNSDIIYLTGDEHEGLLYRFIPNTPGELLDGGRLQALAINEQPSFDTRNWESRTVKVGQIWKYIPSTAEAAGGEANNPGTLKLFVESMGQYYYRNMQII